MPYTVVSIYETPRRRIVHAYGIYDKRKDAVKIRREMLDSPLNQLDMVQLVSGEKLDIKVINILMPGKDYDE